MTFPTSDLRNYFNIFMVLEEFEEYSNIVESQFSKKLKLLEQTASQIDEEEVEDYWDFYFDDYHDTKTTYPSIHRNSLFISIYSFLEYNLTSLCNKLKEQLKLSLSLKELNGSGIERAKIYLKKVVKLNFNDQSSDWNSIINHNLIRNEIVHNRGQIDEHKLSNITKTVDRMNYITIDGDMIRLEKDFCMNFISIVRNFLNELLSEVKQYLSRD